MKKRIYILINSLEGGGAERVVSNLVNLLHHKFHIDVITLKPGTSYNLQNANIINLSKIQNKIGLVLLIPYYIYRFKKLINKNKYQNGISFLEIANFVHILSKKNATISFRTTRGIFDKLGRSGKLYKILIKRLYPKAKLIITNSKENEMITQKELHTQNTKTIYNPIDIKNIKTQSLEPIKIKSINKNKNTIIFTTVARLTKTKNHNEILQTLAQYKKNHNKNFLYLIIGEGPEKKKIKNTIKNLGLQNHVLVLGHQTNVMQYLNMSDYFLYASSNEGFPNTLLEALACHVPVITKDFETGAKEIITGEATKPTQYPVVTEQGILLKATTFQTKLLEILEKIDTYKFSPHIPNEFETKNVISKRETVLNKK